MPSNQKKKGEKEDIKQKENSGKTISKNQRLDSKKSDTSNKRTTVSKKKSVNDTEKNKKNSNGTKLQNSKSKNSVESSSQTKKLSKVKQEGSPKVKKIEDKTTKKKSSSPSDTKKKNLSQKNSKKGSIKSNDEKSAIKTGSSKKNSSLRDSTKKTSQSKQNINLIEKQKPTKNNQSLSKQKITKDKSNNPLLSFLGCLKLKRKTHSQDTGKLKKKIASVPNSKKNTSKKGATSSKKDKKRRLIKFSWIPFIRKKENQNRNIGKNISSKKQLKNKNSIIIPKKMRKMFLILIIICVLIILIETVYFVYHRIYTDHNTIYYDSLNSLSIDNMNVVLVGSGNFKYSKNYDYTNGLEKAKIIKYDSNGKILFEKMYEKGINTTFSSVITVTDGYVVVGSGEFSEKEQQDGGREAVIIKYDKDGNIVWEKYYQVVTNTRFNKVIEVSDGYVVVGQSIYANMEMGNHTTGGGIIVKYDKDGNEVWHNNHGGMKSGNFNDVVEVNGNFYVVGKDATDSANLVKFNSRGEYQWHKNYSYTDGIGFTGITYLDKSLYVVGAKKVLPEGTGDDDNRDTKNTDALFIKYDLDGKIIFEKNFGGSNYDRYNSILAYRDDLYIVGHTTSRDAGLKISTDGELMTGILVRYDQNGNILRKESLGGSNNDNLTDIVTDGVSLYISAYSNSKDGNITTAKNNGKDYFGKFIKLDFKFRTLLVK